MATAAVQQVRDGRAIEPIIDAVSRVLIGKQGKIRLALCCLLARGHLLIEDLPGMGKTTLAQSLATALGLEFRRVQFTSDLLPSDITGVSVFNRNDASFEFHPGPVFSQVLLADEVNRATPKTQSALLEAMAEQQVTVDGVTRSLPEPFFVIATQNPETHGGTFALPESQLDRFLMRIELGYPDATAERKILERDGSVARNLELTPVLDPVRLLALQRQASAVRVSAVLLDYVQRLVAFTRDDPEVGVGLSPRAALGLLACARAWAYLVGRDYVIPEDVQQVFPAVAGHRLRDISRMLPCGHVLVNRVLTGVDVMA